MVPVLQSQVISHQMLQKPLKIKALSFDNSAQITCFGNDYKFENWIFKTLEVFVDKEDLVILLSASGNSKNMINAAKFLNKKKLVSIP